MFFSHASRDEKPLRQLKDLFLAKVGGTVEVFLSSDGQSIPLGRNWVHRIQQALESAKLMVVFVTPHSLGSNWIFFESGFAYAKGIRVVPVGLEGVDLGSLGPPLGLLQGFNIQGADGLNNLVALTNEAFGHQHASRFTDAEYQQVIAAGGGPSEAVFGKYGAAVDRIFVYLIDPANRPPKESWGVFEAIRRDAMSQIADYLKEAQVEHQTKTSESGIRRIYSYGISIENDRAIDMEIDPSIFVTQWPILEGIIRSVRDQGLTGIRVTFRFNSGVRSMDWDKEQNKITARVWNTDVRLDESDHLFIKDLLFHFKTMFAGEPSELATFLYFILPNNELPAEQIRQLLDLLFDREILYFAPAAAPPHRDRAPDLNRLPQRPGSLITIDF